LTNDTKYKVELVFEERTSYITHENILFFASCEKTMKDNVCGTWKLKNFTDNEMILYTSFSSDRKVQMVLKRIELNPTSNKFEIRSLC